MIVHPMQPLREQRNEPFPQIRVLCAEVDYLTLRVRGEDDVVDRFGGQTMPGQFHEAEQIAREKELHDLAPAIGQMLAEANSAAQHFIGMLRGVTFVENGLIVMETQFRPDVLQRDEVSVRSAEYALRIAGSWTDLQARVRPRRLRCCCDRHVLTPLHLKRMNHAWDRNGKCEIHQGFVPDGPIIAPEASSDRQ
jgi:hypothetical protein